MIALGEIRDPTSAVKPNGVFDKIFVTMIRDERDLPFVHLTLRISFVLLPLAALLFVPRVPGWLWWLAAISYLYFNNVVFKGPYGLMMHCTSHRAWFKPEFGLLNHYLPWVIGPFFGQSPETYYAHHVGMHHPENNMPGDDSSTMAYQRDSFRDYSIYVGSFLVAGIYRLCSYFVRKHRSRLLFRALRGEILFFALCIALCFFNWPATLVVFILPLIFFRIIAMTGNWAQHAFVAADDPNNAYKNSVTCINTKYNVKCWNDGYHISHHIDAHIHWTEHPVYFRNTLDEYIKNNAIVFDGIHFLHVFFYLSRGRYDILARHFVNIGNRFQSDDEVIALMKDRTRKIDVSRYVNG